MAYVIGMISQKGGVGKSTLSRLVARELAASKWDVKIADFDVQQQTSTKWAADRAGQGLSPEVRVEAFSSVKSALKDAPGFDAYIMDGRPHADKQTWEIASACDVIVIPTNETKDCLLPSVTLANALADGGIDAKRIVFALVKSSSAAEVKAARAYLDQTDFDTLAGDLPHMTGYKKSLDLGRSPSETMFPSLNDKAETLAQSLVDRLASLNSQKEVA